MRRIGIRELRQNASKYIRLVKAGETIEVTERGVPVACLKPLEDAKPAESPYERLVREGKIVPPTKDWSDWKPIVLPPGGPPLSKILEELREDRV
ncbi:MAG: type II toxin-antitoxin system Phd/YefM family antitoxin [Dehalococcoidia bacterium]